MQLPKPISPNFARRLEAVGGKGFETARIDQW